MPRVKIHRMGRVIGREYPYHVLPRADAERTLIFCEKIVTGVQRALHFICSIHNAGMDAMQYEWINNGLRGLAHSREVHYILPQYLSSVGADFPSNVLAQKIIDVNFTYDKHHRRQN